MASTNTNKLFDAIRVEDQQRFSSAPNIIPIQVAATSVLALLDSGSEANLISEAVAADIFPPSSM